MTWRDRLYAKERTLSFEVSHSKPVSRSTSDCSLSLEDCAQCVEEMWWWWALHKEKQVLAKWNRLVLWAYLARDLVLTYSMSIGYLWAHTFVLLFLMKPCLSGQLKILHPCQDERELDDVRCRYALDLYIRRLHLAAASVLTSRLYKTCPLIHSKNQAWRRGLAVFMYCVTAICLREANGRGEDVI